MAKMNVNAFLQKDYENETAFRPKKTNPIQTQTKPVLSAVEWANFRNAKMNLKLLSKKSGHTRSAEITKIGCIHISKKYNALIESS